MSFFTEVVSAIGVVVGGKEVVDLEVAKDAEAVNSERAPFLY